MVRRQVRLAQMPPVRTKGQKTGGRSVDGATILYDPSGLYGSFSRPQFVFILKIDGMIHL